MKHSLTGLVFGLGLALSPLASFAGANPSLPFYGGGTITVTPHYPIVGESTHLEVVVKNTGDAPATNVKVRISFNDWGVTFNGWQEIATVALASIPAGGSATATADHVFTNPAHTCVEALVTAADEDSDPADNRSQINLEVIHAGDSFTYGVPLRNEGDVPLKVDLRGGCDERDPANSAAAAVVPEKRRCEVVARDGVVIEPGQEIRVPVAIDLAGLPPGAKLDYLLVAVDQFGNRNHVVVQVTHATAKGLKIEAAAMANRLAGEMPTRALRQRMENVAKHIEQSLRIRRWLNENEVSAHGGSAVFAQEMAAVAQATSLLGARLPVAVKNQINAILLKLTDADRILASHAIAAAGEDLDEDLMVDAAELLGAGDQARETGRYARAIETYRRAWHLATR